MLRYLFILVLVLPRTFGFSQNSNPFDLLDRDDIPAVIDVVTTDTTNPFEVRDTVIVGSIDTTTTTPLVRDDILRGNNPFEVDHVPIRRRARATTEIEEVNTDSSKKNSSTSLLFVFLLQLLCLILIAIVLNTQHGALPKLFKSLTNENILKINLREQEGGGSGVYLILYSIFFINIALFLFVSLLRTGLWPTSLKWWYILLATLFLYVGRHIAMTILRAFFPIKREANLYNFTIITYNIAIGVVLIPFILLIAYGPGYLATPMIYTSVALIIIILCLRLLRGLTISAPFIVSRPLHFLLYLCGFEIAPILLIISKIS